MSASESEPGQDARIARAKAFYNKVKADGDTRKLDAALHKFKEVCLFFPAGLISRRPQSTAPIGCI